jgi:hypothetical protein
MLCREIANQPNRKPSGTYLRAGTTDGLLLSTGEYDPLAGKPGAAFLLLLRRDTQAAFLRF